MDALTKLMRRIDRTDDKMIVLFEKRMRMVRAMTKYKLRHDIKIRRHDADIIEKTVCGFSDTDTIVYTEGLMRYLYAAAEKYARAIVKRQ